MLSAAVPLGAVDQGELNAHDRRRIASWQPQTVGEVFFSFRD